MTMALIDLSAQASIKASYTEDSTSGLTTVTFSTSGDAQLGQFKIETLKLRSFLEAMALAGKEFIPVTAPSLIGVRTTIDPNNLLATMVFG